MKIITNISNSSFDLSRYRDNADLKQFYRSLKLDGLEVIDALGADENDIIQDDDILGVHLRYFNEWMSIWNGDMAALSAEYGSDESIKYIFGGRTREDFLKSCKKNISFVSNYNPQYMVFHVSNATLSQTITRIKKHGDDEVVTAAINVINSLFNLQTQLTNNDCLLLFENLWWSGMTMLDPKLTQRLLSGVHYKNKGVMLDIGHLLHTNTKLRTQDEAVDFIHSVLDRYDNLDFIKGIHLHQSLSGEYAESVMSNPPEIPQGDYAQKAIALHDHIIKVDTHKPFTSKKIAGIVERVAPEYLVLEFITKSREEHSAYITDQMRYL
ncbi:MAG: TIM barrel protein [Termitinemataceae bacterium]|nr:MAG: TIM barrel protein [Termitinemataceae bacterium]